VNNEVGLPFPDEVTLKTSNNHCMGEATHRHTLYTEHDYRDWRSVDTRIRQAIRWNIRVNRDFMIEISTVRISPRLDRYLSNVPQLLTRVATYQIWLGQRWRAIDEHTITKARRTFEHKSVNQFVRHAFTKAHHTAIAITQVASNRIAICHATSVVTERANLTVRAVSACNIAYTINTPTLSPRSLLAEVIDGN
jgi:hypothetical protein